MLKNKKVSEKKIFETAMPSEAKTATQEEEFDRFIKRQERKRFVNHPLLDKNDEVIDYLILVAEGSKMLAEMD